MNPIEKAFWEYSEPYTGMSSVDMDKSSHGRAFKAGWEAAIKHMSEQPKVRLWEAHKGFTPKQV